MLLVHLTACAMVRLEDLRLPVEVFDDESETAWTSIVPTPVVVILLVTACLCVEEKLGAFEVKRSGSAWWVVVRLRVLHLVQV